ncbi:MAG: hypothetical protein FJ319_04460 [SAR202 cluster bacterium]|nr:hypothetical protein [SAR202 cluster bacterium]
MEIVVPVMIALLVAAGAASALREIYHVASRVLAAELPEGQGGRIEASAPDGMDFEKGRAGDLELAGARS